MGRDLELRTLDVFNETVLITCHLSELVQAFTDIMRGRKEFTFEELDDLSVKLEATRRVADEIREHLHSVGSEWRAQQSAGPPKSKVLGTLGRRDAETTVMDVQELGPGHSQVVRQKLVPAEPHPIAYADDQGRVLPATDWRTED